MTRSIHIVGADADTAKSIVELGVLEALAGAYPRVGVFLPIAASTQTPPPVLEALRQRASVPLEWADCIGVSYTEIHDNPDAAHAQIIARYLAVARQCDAVAVLGTDFSDVGGPSELALNARVAANLAAPVALVVNARGLSPAKTRSSIELAVQTIRENHAEVVAAFANRCDAATLQAVRDLLEPLDYKTFAIPESRVVLAPSVRAVMDAISGRLVAGDQALLDAEALVLTVGAMEPEHLVERLRDGSVVITPGDRAEVLLTLVTAHAAGGFPSLAGVILNGGFLPPEPMMRLVAGLGQSVPVIQTDLGTYATACRAGAVRGEIGPNAPRKIGAALTLFERNVDARAVSGIVGEHSTEVITPARLEHTMLERAQADRKRIVLPEGSDPRILRAAARILELGAADLTILGNPVAIELAAGEAGLDLAGADIVDPAGGALVERFAQEFAQIRAAKGVTLDQARQTMAGSATYVGTMMVHTGLADGMVSGASHTTADTIRPAFQIIKTQPGVKVVSSVFLMALADKVLVFGDCAVNPNPTVEQLADIAISSAMTARTFGVEPRVAMLSYSTGLSGAGPDVDQVREATELVRQRAPELAVEGPIQYDAAVDPVVAAGKMPDSTVAGRASVLIFPDLNSGNIAYKAVQRSSGALAIGPVLQGLRRPVNDLSRGALVDDIVNTVIITAIQAQ
ncbi:MAG: phosphate acetyltransferase [Bifidobacteriaceae bacterium]|nr:phosphate acetyltransferase [Bifidobacteriaceae bacterium]